MNAEWQKKLIGFGVEQSDGGWQYPARVDAENILCTLASDTILHVSGEDAESFLQGQFSNDIAALSQPGSQLSTWSSPKGRVITLFRVLRVADGFLIKISSELIEPVLKRLRMYVLRAKVVIEPRDDLIAVGISGDKATATLSNLPESIDQTVALSSTCWITRVRGAKPRFELIGDAEQLAEICKQGVEAGQWADEAAWRLQDIDAAVPSVNAATTEAFVLQMMNLQHIDGVSFKKGCFPGQEVVARMQYLGKLKRQMYRMQYEGEELPVAGDEIFKQGGGSAAGKIVDAVAVKDNTSRLLAVIAIDATNGPMFLDKEGRHPVQLLELPYELLP